MFFKYFLFIFFIKNFSLFNVDFFSYMKEYNVFYLTNSKNSLKKNIQYEKKHKTIKINFFCQNMLLFERSKDCSCNDYSLFNLEPWKLCLGSCFLVSMQDHKLVQEIHTNIR